MNMFTGIVQGTGIIQSIENHGIGRVLSIHLPSVEKLQRGASVAINGVCLTATEIVGHIVRFDVISETLSRTNLGSLSISSSVNVERSLRFGDEVGGHILSGHIIGMGEIVEVANHAEGIDLQVKAPSALMKYIQEKGYIALNGVSLTVGLVHDNNFNVHLIPETIRMTTFGSIAKNERINIEIDSTTQTIVETVERIMKQQK